MIKFAKVVNKESGLCIIGEGKRETKIYRELGFRELKVRQSDIDKNWYIYDLCPMRTREEKEREEEERFRKDFFSTSLGNVRRKVNMSTGEIRDFLFDIKPTLKVGVPIITYDRDGKQNTGVKTTQNFLEECEIQVYVDFYGVKPKYENKA